MLINVIMWDIADYNKQSNLRLGAASTTGQILQPYILTNCYVKRTWHTTVYSTRWATWVVTNVCSTLWWVLNAKSIGLVRVWVRVIDELVLACASRFYWCCPTGWYHPQCTQLGREQAPSLCICSIFEWHRNLTTKHIIGKLLEESRKVCQV